MSARNQPLLGVAIAIAITATMDANGLSAFSALPLLPLMALFWYFQRNSHTEIGLVRSRPGAYGTALLHPLLVIGAITLIVALTGAMHATTEWSKPIRSILIVSAATFVVAIVTEEGFFRGWLWASLRRAGLRNAQTLVWSSIAFALWHVSSVVLPTGFNPAPAQIPIFLINAAVIGAIWGMLRMASGSIVVSSLAHGVWNGFEYVLYGFGTHVGALGVTKTALYGPEIGILGLVANALFAAALWYRVRALLIPPGNVVYKVR